MATGLSAMWAKTLSTLHQMRDNPFPHEDQAEDASETVYIRPLPLLKILTHARAGVPFEVMGVLLGKLVDQYTLHVSDVFPMPQVASTVAVDVLEHSFQVDMKGMLEEVGLVDEFVGWYHSHPGYGCSLSIVDRDTQAGFQGIQPRAVALVVDPVQSVRGRVVLENFRVTDVRPQQSFLAILAPMKRPRHITSFVGITSSKGPDYRKQLSRGLQQHYYKLNTTYQTREEEVPVLAAINHGLHLSREAADAGLRRVRTQDPAVEMEKLTKLTKAFLRKVKKEKEGDGKEKKDGKKEKKEDKDEKKKEEKKKEEKKKEQKKKDEKKGEEKKKGEEEGAFEFGKDDTRARLLAISRRLIDRQLLSGIRTGILVGVFSTVATPASLSTPTTTL